MTVTMLSSRLRNMKFMKRSKNITDQHACKKKKRASKKKINDPNVQYGVVEDDSMNMNQTFGRRSFGGFNVCLEKSIEYGHDNHEVSIAAKPEIEKPQEIQKDLAAVQNKEMNPQKKVNRSKRKFRKKGRTKTNDPE